MTALEWIISICLLSGGLFVLLGSVTLLKLPDFYTRLHGPTKATTLGLGSLVLASLLYFNFQLEQLSLQQLLLALFLFISAPITAHLLIKVALHYQLPAHPATKGQPQDTQSHVD